MLIDRLQITESSTIINATVASGPSFPTDPSIGELFYRTDLGALQTYTVSGWVDTGYSPVVQGQVATLNASIASASSNAGAALATHAADATLHLTSLQNTLLDGLTLPSLTSTQVNYLIGVTSPIQTQIATKFNSAGGTISGATTVSGVLTASAGVTGLPITPTTSTDATSKSYVDTLVSTSVSAATSSGTSALAAHAGDTTLHLTPYQNTLLDGISTSLTATEVNYLSGVTSSIQTQLNTLSSTKLNISGGTITGALNVNGLLSVSSGITGLPLSPSGATDAVSKSYVDSIAAGITWKQAVSATTTANIPLSGFPTIDGFTLTNGNRVLVKNQTNQAENGIYTANSGSWLRATDADTGAELTSAAVFVSNGSTWGNTGWVQTTPTITLGSTPVVWSQFAGGNIGAIVAGNGINVVGLNVSVNAGSGLIFSGTQLTLNTSPRVVLTSNALDLASITSSSVVGGSSSIPQISYDQYGRVTSSQSFALNTSNITEGSNLFFTTARAQSALSVAGGGISYAGGVITLNSTGSASTLTLVQRDSNGSFAANVVTANSFVGATTLNVLKTGDTMTGQLKVQAGIRAAAGSPDAGNTSNVGFSFDDDGDTGLFTYGGSSGTHNALSLYLNNAERLKVVSGGNVFIDNSIVWHQGNLSDLSQLTNGPGYITSAALAPYATTASLSSYAKTSSLSGYTPLDGTGAHGYWNIDISGTAHSANTIPLTNVSSGSTLYPVLATNTASTQGLSYSSAKLSFNPTSGDLTAAGNVTAYSDERLKDNIQPITGALAKVEQLTGVTFTRKDTNQRGTGLIAQDVLKVLPEAVVTGEEGYLSLAYGNLVGLLVEAIKELKAEVEELKARQA